MPHGVIWEMKAAAPLIVGGAAEDTDWAVYAFMLQNHPH